jgi:Ca-activated chloride channel family protein
VYNLFYFNVLKHPWFLLLLIGAFLLLIAELVGKHPAAVTISTGDTLARIRTYHRTFLRRLPAILRFLGLVFLIIALARPLNNMRVRSQNVDVRDIVLAVDVSGSMTQEDFTDSNKRPRDRLYVTKLAVKDFINSRKLNETDRYGTDRVGLLLYAAYPWLQVPLTLDYDLLEYDLDRVEIDQRDEKHNRTAIGMALGLATVKLIKSPAQTKVIILLTDGINNAGELDPITAASVAHDYNIRVYTIGAGSPAGPNRDNPIDEDTLKKIAGATGGKYYRATNLASLQEAYDEINQLETTKMEIEAVYDYDEGFAPWAFVGLLLVTASILTRRQWFEAIP